MYKEIQIANNCNKALIPLEYWHIYFGVHFNEETEKQISKSNPSVEFIF